MKLLTHIFIVDHSMMIMPSGTDVPIDPSTTEPATDVSGAIKKHFSVSPIEWDDMRERHDS